jgi:hypothetical protein
MGGDVSRIVLHMILMIVWTVSAFMWSRVLWSRVFLMEYRIWWRSTKKALPLLGVVVWIVISLFSVVAHAFALFLIHALRPIS